MPKVGMSAACGNLYHVDNSVSAAATLDLHSDSRYEASGQGL